MEKKRRKASIKKIIAVFCVFMLLQSYFSYFAQIVIATSETIIGESVENNEVSQDNETTVGEDMTQSQENKGNDEQTVGEEGIANDEDPPDSEQGENETIVGDDGNSTVIGENGNEITEEQTGNPFGTTTQEEQNEVTQEQGENEQTEETQNQNESQSDATEEQYVEPSATIEVTSENSSIYKGYLYANATSDLGYATNYNTIDVLNVVGGKNIGTLTVQDEPDKIGLITDTKIGLLNNMYYRQTRISVEEFNNLLGVDGSITLYTSEGETIGLIDKNSDVKDGEYVFTYPTQFNSVRFELTNIINDGTISIKNDKAIKETSDFNRNQISLFSTINTMANVNIFEEGKEVKTYSAEGNINLEETESRMTINSDVTTLSVEEKNQLAISITLKTDEERYDLFENPTIELEFPSAVESIDVTGITLLYKNGLSIDNWDITTNDIGKKVIKINLSGSQLEYTPGAVQEGTTVVLYVDVDVNRLTADSSEALRMTYTNKDTVRKTYSLEGKDSEDIQFNFVGRQELVRALRITEPDVATAVSYDDETEKIQILTNQEQTVTMTGSIVNNYEATLNDVVIIGRIPFVGNKDGNKNNLGTNFDTTLKNQLTTSGVVADVYYSEDGEADNSSDSWTTDLGNLNNYKSFKIVIREKTLVKGERLTFEYNLNVPADVSYNAIGYSNYVVYYKMDSQNYWNQCTTGMFTETKEIDLDDIEEKDKQDLAELTIGTQVSQGGFILGETDSVYERQVLKYTVVVKNTSNIEANNIVIRAKAENANIYDWNYLSATEYGFEIPVRQMKEYSEQEKEYVEFTIDKLNQGETKTFEYSVIVRDLSEIEVPEVYGNISVLINGQEIKEVQTFKNQIKEGKVEVILQTIGTEAIDETENKTDLARGMYGSIKNITNEDLENIRYIVILPSCVTVNEEMFDTDTGVKDIKIEKIADNSTKLTFSIPKLKAGETENVSVFVKNSKMTYTILSTKMIVTSYVELGDEQYYSNDYSRTIYQRSTKLEYNLTSNVDKEYVEDGEEIIFNLNAKNVGFNNSDIITVNAVIPSGLEIVNIEFDNSNEYNSNEYDSEELQATLSVDEAKEQNLIITTKVNKKLFELNQKVIEFGMNIDEGQGDILKTNIISYKINNDNITKYRTEENDDNDVFDNDNNIEQNEPNEQQNDQQNNNEQVNDQIPEEEDPLNDVESIKYNISGLAWVDSNQDGIRQSDEKLQEAVIASLYKANDNGGIDVSTVLATTSTDNEGRYVFDNVENGDYIIVFDYNSSRYKLTKYQVDTATSTENSDVISKAITINGETRMLGTTDVLTVENSGLLSIDIGLIDNTNFDLSLKKSISSIKVKNDEGEKVYNYEDKEDKRIEIRSKYYKSSVLDITYKFEITNEGDVSGYVNKIIDYLPENVQVVLNSSPDWYISSDNGLYYTGLMEQEIAPGETKEFTLVIRKSLENGEAVKLTNGAEIVEYTNFLGLTDRDSIENNNMNKEDDYGEITLLVSVSTGNTIQYITMTFTIIIMISTILMITIKIKNTKKVYR